MILIDTAKMKIKNPNFQQKIRVFYKKE